MYDVANQWVFRILLNFSALNVSERNRRNIAAGLFDKVVVLHIPGVIETRRNQTQVPAQEEARQGSRVLRSGKEVHPRQTRPSVGPILTRRYMIYPDAAADRKGPPSPGRTNFVNGVVDPIRSIA